MIFQNFSNFGSQILDFTLKSRIFFTKIIYFAVFETVLYMIFVIYNYTFEEKKNTAKENSQSCSYKNASQV